MRSKSVAVLVLILLALCPIEKANACTFCLCVSDQSCTDGDCGNPTGCEVQTFTAPCTGEYQFRSKVICTGAADRCYNCQSCTNIYVHSTGQFVAGCHNSHCDFNVCEYPCTANLTKGKVYRLEVCKRVCVPGLTCLQANCSATCKAYGCVYRNVSTPCVPL